MLNVERRCLSNPPLSKVPYGIILHERQEVRFPVKSGSDYIGFVLFTSASNRTLWLVENGTATLQELSAIPVR